MPPLLLLHPLLLLPLLLLLLLPPLLLLFLLPLSPLPRPSSASPLLMLLLRLLMLVHFSEHRLRGACWVARSVRSGTGKLDRLEELLHRCAQCSRLTRTAASATVRKQAVARRLKLSIITKAVLHTRTRVDARSSNLSRIAAIPTDRWKQSVEKPVGFAIDV